MGQISRFSAMVAAVFGGMFLQGCSAGGVAYGPIVEKFAVSVRLVTTAVNESFKYVDLAHNHAQSDQIALQYALDGTPGTTFNNLFSSDDIKARAAVADALNAYAEKLLSTVSGKDISSVTDSVKSAAVALSRTSMKNFDLSHSLPAASSATLKAAGNNFATLLIEPAQGLRLARLVKRAESDFHKLSVLLYADIGSSVDQVSSCQFETPSQPENLSLHGLKLCEGGLRSVSQLVFADDIGTLKAHIDVLSKKSAADLPAKDALVSRMLTRRQDGKAFDVYMSRLQNALVLMDEAHSSLAQLFSSKVDFRTTDFDAFEQAAAALASLAPWSNSASSSSNMTASNPSLEIETQDDSVQESTLTPVADGEIHEKIQSLRTALNKLDLLLDKDMPLDQLKSTLVARNKLSEQIEAIDLVQIEQRNTAYDKTIANLATIKGDLVKIKKWIEKAKTATAWARATIQAIVALIALL